MSEGECTRAAVVIASTRSAAGITVDQTGPMIRDWLTARGHDVVSVAVVADGEPVREALHDALAQGVDLLLTSGGTGLTPTDRTPEMTRGLLDFEVPGIAESLRAAGVAAGIPTAMLSRGLAGVADGALVINLPGSPGGVRDGFAVLEPVLDHALAQIVGSDHPRS